MSNVNKWTKFPLTYRAAEMTTLAEWLTIGESGTVCGLPGTGRSTFLAFLYHRPEALATYLPSPGQTMTLVPVDLNSLPDDDLATFYRVIVRALYEAREQFDESTAQLAVQLHNRYRHTRDPFLAQTSFRELLLVFQEKQMRLVLLLNHFDVFCQMATPRMTSTLRSLRDSFRGTLSYIVGMKYEISYLADLPAVEPLLQILDTHICWLGPLNRADAGNMIQRQLTRLGQEVSAETAADLWRVTGGIPSLLRVACQWWLTKKQRPVAAEWAAILAAQENAQHRLAEIWQAMTQTEQAALLSLRRGGRGAALQARYGDILAQLEVKGICRQVKGEWQIVGEMIPLYVDSAAGMVRGKLWWDETSGEVYQGEMRIEHLAPQEKAVLQFLLEFPRQQHTHSEIIAAAWSPEVNKAGVSTDALYQVVRGLRQKIEPDRAHPCYLINWRGQPEGGYQLYPEGRPR